MSRIKRVLSLSSVLALSVYVWGCDSGKDGGAGDAALGVPSVFSIKRSEVDLPPSFRSARRISLIGYEIRTTTRE